MCMGYHYKKLDEGGLTKLKSLEGALGKRVVAIEKDKEIAKLAEVSTDDVMKIQSLEKELGTILLAYKG